MQLPSSEFPAIEVTHLSKRVADATGELSILQDVNFTVPAGATLAIVGASGSGKSTLLGLLAGLDTPSDGTVRIHGVDLYALDEDGRAGLRKKELGFVFQSFQLLSHLTALENVMLPLELRGESGAKARDAAAAMLAITRNSFLVVNSNGLRWRAPSSPSRRCCWPTNRPEASMQEPAKLSSS
jgi:putative ABC transport system ATP-binding protein